MTTLEEKKKNYWLMLRKFYDLAKGQPDNYIINMWEVGEELGWDRETINATYDYLQGERLLKAMTLGGGATITHEGVKEVEEAEEHPEKPTLHFPPIIVYINGDIAQGGRANRRARLMGDSYRVGKASAVRQKVDAHERQEAEQYYQQALQIKIEFNDRYSQASTYHQLGRVAQEQQQWQQAREYLLKDLSLIAEFGDEYGLRITLGSLARLWEESGDEGLPATIAETLNVRAKEVEEALHKMV